ncbi:MAG TPA: radical SAM protein [Planctomycetota bacterium]|nr:radical SAM protein [Planctomycetota bacterium]
MHPTLLEPLPGFLILELTTRCNLKCLYCAVSQPGYIGRDLQVDMPATLEAIRELGVGEVQLSAHGEATLVPGWHDIARALEDAGLRVLLTTNLSKRFSPEELAAFARMQTIAVSIDTVNPELFARLRRPARFERLCENLAHLRAHIPARGAARPYLAVNCTVSEHVIDGLSDLVRWAAREEFDAVSLVNLVVYPTVDPEFPVRHPARVDPARATARIDEAQALAHQLGLAFNVMEGLRTALAEARES